MCGARDQDEAATIVCNTQLFENFHSGPPISGTVLGVVIKVTLLLVSLVNVCQARPAVVADDGDEHIFEAWSSVIKKNAVDLSEPSHRFT